MFCPLRICEKGANILGNMAKIGEKVADQQRPSSGTFWPATGTHEMYWLISSKIQYEPLHIVIMQMS